MEQAVIFLDIDMVITDKDYQITSECVLILNQLLEHFQAEIVLISSRFLSQEAYYGTDIARNKATLLLQNHGICTKGLNFITTTFVSKKQPQLSYRTLGIIDYLNQHPDVSYIILDDEYHDQYQEFNLHFYPPIRNRSLKKEDFYQIQVQKYSSCIPPIYYHRAPKFNEYQRLARTFQKIYEKRLR